MAPIICPLFPVKIVLRWYLAEPIQGSLLQISVSKSSFVFALALSIERGCRKTFFMSESGTTQFNYKQVEKMISNAELTETELSQRLTEVYEHDVYTLHITEPPK
ncbi:hypothetical protein COW36_13660 [bacterium (Candidatus Blackallbacteria) CG17_big_fil_post_rev_8_21_14_2_50_48_46]|uniref:Uncharacterized protein n=1 Tax=bacterium (Candidatus Blackallbacteria) CG17_big_fil_post_rev_8_21_14_2_50_48_46 TaxID=2014261 RepID=A0A2M7G3R8_9BACT|nr:MAG: hypothetical protein COW64_22280 [bacterium (Candidatus Blackallbacteria) CG18_big_fil_WC_8_21_14_2_50_49_26]PIW16371.1 MAG: hypothetical protein COW36_13660 [bacterium (Candidatus Blackallbacteria) CG17_big_fil_post_rev_8_21_14_2_50_48_46]PIW45384.1 MAG: hypothetical protein COW20_20895 [bacterium (Candidatus Blackallbacteria) CG13_big_fil_rev_8_21_14_2_50_49_14]